MIKKENNTYLDSLRSLYMKLSSPSNEMIGISEKEWVDENGYTNIETYDKDGYLVSHSIDNGDSRTVRQFTYSSYRLGKELSSFTIAIYNSQGLAQQRSIQINKDLLRLNTYFSS